MDALIEQVTEFVKEYMKHFDVSHDFEHIRRVVGLAKTIEKTQRDLDPTVQLDSNVIILASLMHDVGDKKYLKPYEDGTVVVEYTLQKFGADPELARKIQNIVSNVSYSNEIAYPEQVQAVLAVYPELAIVQDADRLDAMGAIGIGRTFTYNTIHCKEASLAEPIKHIEEKLFNLSSMMKTAGGRKIALVRDQRLRLFREWWIEEGSVVDAVGA